ncbi:hypothetical protein E3N88_28199 [Mikania micrantha]|uniref:Endonuclease/exonuclease/phosphatase domain-containing protein n=1 Tax=Mikania micrantha TaxID=192012 RepID=A0A5N6MYY7_9ASTR|nr:hypothetical protein E3N88_28199 [Mikania micrantha]
MVLGEEVVTVMSAYAPHVGLGENEKRQFWDCMDEENEGFQSIHGGCGFGSRNESGGTLLDFAIAHDLGIINSFFRKKDSHLITFSSGGWDTQIDYLLMRQGDRGRWMDCKVFPGEAATSQHKLLVADIVMHKKLVEEKKVTHKIRWGRLKGYNLKVFKDKVLAGRVNMRYDDANIMWEAMAENVIRVAKETLGMTTKNLGGQKEAWWWNDEVQHKVRTKHERFTKLVKCREEAQNESLKTKYKEAKRQAKKAVMEVKNTAYKEMYKRLGTKEGEHDMFKISKAREHRREDVGVLTFIKNEEGRILVKENDIKKRWQTYFRDLFNNSSDTEDSENDTTRGASINKCYCRRITKEEVQRALRRMGRAKAVGPDNIPIEAWKCLEDEGVTWLTALFNNIFRTGKMPDQWRSSVLIPLYKKKGDAQRCENYRGIKFLSHTMKL